MASTQQLFQRPMSNKLHTHETKTETLADDASMTVMVRVTSGEFLTTLVSDGSGGAPAAHDIDWHQRPTDKASDGEGDEWMPTVDPDAADTTNTTKTWWIDEDPAPNYWRATVTNRSGGSATFRARLVSHGGDE